MRFKAWIILKSFVLHNKNNWLKIKTDITLFTSDTSAVHQKMAASEQETRLLKRNHQFARLKRLY